MKYYQDITLLPDPETDLYFLWKKVYQQIHLALVERKDGNNRAGVGVAFPKYVYSKSRKHLGNKLRLFASTESELSELNAGMWLERLQDYTHLTQIREVPANTRPVIFSRKPVKSLEKIATRRAEHLSISFDDALAYLVKEGRSDECDLPFIQMESLSSKANSSGRNRFPLFVEKKHVSEPAEGLFDCYGLSKSTTVPWF